MNKKEITIIVICALLLVLLYQFFSKSEIIFPERVKPQKETINLIKYIPHIPDIKKGIKKLTILNPRGDTFVRGGTSEEIKITIEIFIPEKDLKKSESIIKSKKFLKVDQETLIVNLSLDLKVPSSLTITNITIELPVSTEILLNNQNGNFSCKNVQGLIKGQIINSKISEIHNFNKLSLYTENSILKITKGKVIDLKSVNSNYDIRHISTKSILDTDRGKVELSDVHGDIEVISNNTSYQMKNLLADLIFMKNRHKDISMDNIQANKIKIFSFGTRISIHFLNVKNSLLIDGGKHGGDIFLKFPKNILPKYNVKNNYGKIIFTRDEIVILKNSKVFSSLTNTAKKKPEITIKNSYSDITINNSK